MDTISSKYFFDSQFTFMPQENIRSSFREYISLSENHTLDVQGVRVVVRREEWDSQRLGKSVGRVVWMDNNIQNVEHYEQIIKKLSAFDCYYLRFNQEHSFCKFSAISSSHSRPWHLATKVSMFCRGESLTDNVTEPFEFVDVIAEKDLRLLSQVGEIAAKSFPHNRFSNDPHFSTAFVEGMYNSWVEHEYEKTTTRLYALTENGKVQAFVLLNVNFSPIKGCRPIVFVSLIATRPEFREKQIGQNLLRFAASKHCLTREDYLIANTELRNFSAINFFMANGFRIQAALHEYHLWNECRSD